MSVRGRDYVKDINEIKVKLDRWIENLDNSEEFLNKQMENLRTNALDFNDQISKGLHQMNDKIENDRKRVFKTIK